jgi:RNA polymerase sigma-70 factor (ECF subfamily)
MSPLSPVPTAWDDDRLRLVFTCCHPALPLEGRVALTCKVVAGLSTAAVARAFLVPEATMGQRLLRAKRKIAHAGIPYRVPAPEQVAERLDGVLAVVYLVFTTGWAAADDDTLAAEAIRLGRLLVRLVPRSEEARALLALMLLQHARRPARLVDGELVTLEHQDRSRWDERLTDEGLTLLEAADRARGPYRLQAELAAVHARAASAKDTDWPEIVRLYDELLDVHPSPVVSLNRAVAVGMADGPVAGLAVLEALTRERVLAGHHLLPAARADLLARAGRANEAVRALEQAVRLAPTDQERRQLARRRDELDGGLRRG